MTRAEFFVMKADKRTGQYYRQKVNGVEFKVSWSGKEGAYSVPVRAYIHEGWHIIYFIDAETGVSFADYVFPFEREFDTDKHLRHAPQYLDADVLAGYLNFREKRKDTPGRQMYRELQKAFMKAPVKEG